MLCLRFEILSESFNLRKKFKLRHRNVNYPCYELKKLTIFIVENMITHPPFMFYYKHFFGCQFKLCFSENILSENRVFGKYGCL